MAEFRTIRKGPSIPEVVFQEVHKLITEGELRPGDNLPSEMELTERFGVGRSSIREAMRALQLMGVIEVIQGKGTFVREVGVSPLMIDWSRVNKIGVLSEVMEARQFIEVLLAQLAAERATEADVNTLRGALEHSQDCLEDPNTEMGTLARAGIDFHMAIADAAHNKILTMMYRTVRDMYPDLARCTRITPEIAQARDLDHEELLVAISNGDPEEAARIMREHLEKAYQIMSANEGGKEPVSE
ncbi:MAG: FadR/GntR family transcriptional regulator [Anaerolineales bacterium]|jgi:GntR family transcriptional repressor for pyruvate dehydrogenase complex|nr:FadR/GntR family transcriptional regulator [Anaerolineales bacterium]|tara:strand:+ start:94 stop:822 length:729 start_codon:yes stop_codon:yes gene_type:complete